jgi:hypothetical protein
MVFAKSRMRDTFLEGNMAGEFNEASDFLSRPFAPLGKMNLAPTDGNIRKHAEGDVRFDIYPDADLDFDGDLHGKGGIGAYALGKVKPRWVPMLEIKPAPFAR